MVLDCGRGTASHVAHRAWTYQEPARHLAALTERALDQPRAEVLADVLPLAYDGPPRGLCDGPPRPRFARTSCQRRLRPAVTHRPAAAVGPRQPPRSDAAGRAGRRALPIGARVVGESVPHVLCRRGAPEAATRANVAGRALEHAPGSVARASERRAARSADVISQNCYPVTVAVWSVCRDAPLETPRAAARVGTPRVAQKASSPAVTSSMMGTMSS